MRRSLALSLFCSLLSVGSALAEAPPAGVAIRAGRLLDVASERVREGAVVVEEDGRDREVGSSVPTGAMVVVVKR